MRLSHEAIAEFRALHRKHYSTDLTDDEAEREALALIRFVATIQPLKHTIHAVVRGTAVE